MKLAQRENRQNRTGGGNEHRRPSSPTNISHEGNKGSPRGSGGAVARVLASRHGEPGSIPGGFTPRFSHVGIVLDDTACRWVFSGYSGFTPPSHSGAAPYSARFPLSALKTSLSSRYSDMGFQTLGYEIAYSNSTTNVLVLHTDKIRLRVLFVRYVFITAMIVSCPVAPTSFPIRDRVILVPNRDPVRSWFQRRTAPPTELHDSGPPIFRSRFQRAGKWVKERDMVVCVEKTPGIALHHARTAGCVLDPCLGIGDRWQCGRAWRHTLMEYVQPYPPLRCLTIGVVLLTFSLFGPQTLKGFVGRPDVVKGFVGRPDVVKGFVGRPDVVKGFVGRPDVVKGFVGRPDVVKGFVGRPDVVKGFVGWPDVVKGFVGRPDVVKGFVGRPDVVKGFVGRPDVVKGFVGRPDVVKGFVGRPDVVKGFVGRPDVVKGFVGRPDVVKEQHATRRISLAFPLMRTYLFSDWLWEALVTGLVSDWLPRGATDWFAGFQSLIGEWSSGV
ncbi:hypothetical protein PR048_007198 [Dryococelus australis]|uniref:Uncharacterized protein n=1 Tax=Dryococelus australis TaxID=614101 RepID=A0ABQ9ID41_9NEOP|nr:hypothetical protein PR048_007198 [Dryococelus australis]